MQFSTPKGPSVKAEGSVRNLTRERAHSERTPSKRSHESGLGGSLREYLDLRLALHEKDKQILLLHAEAREELKGRLALEESSLRHRRETTEASDRALTAERELHAAQVELSALRSELGDAQFHLTAARAELRALHDEFTALQNELGETCLRTTALRTELSVAESELQAARSLAVGPSLDGANSAALGLAQSPEVA